MSENIDSNKSVNLKKVKLTINELFSGIGCQSRGFENSELFDIEVLNTSDINKEAVLSYAAIHCEMTNETVENYKDYPSREEMARYLTDINLGYEPEKNKKFDWFKLVKRKNNDLEKYWLACKLTNNLGDISKIEELPYADFWTISFPCQSISIAGKMKGLKPDSGTRSSLLWDNIRLLKKAKDNNTLPKYLMFENVKNLVSKKFINDFNDLLDIIDELGFNSYWSVINGKDCGIPQNRERVFVICIRKDIDNDTYEFPKPFDIGIRLKHVLEQTVADKYYIAQDKMDRFITNLNNDNALLYDISQIKRENKAREYNEYSPTLSARDYKDPKIINDNIIKQVGQMYGTEKEPNPQAGRVYDGEYLSPTLDTCSGGNRMPKIIQVGKLSSSQDAVVVSTDGITPTHTAGHGNTPKILEKFKFRIRKLTPRECFRLMGLTFEDCDKAVSVGVSDTHLYKQAGNGIITNCCELLAEHLYKAQYDDTYVCTDEVLSNLSSDNNNIIVRGNYTPSGHDASRIVDQDGIAPCVKENHGTVTAVLTGNFQQP